MPNRDFYTKGDTKSQETRDRFREYVISMFKLLGDTPESAAAKAAKVLAIQTRLATASLTSQIVLGWKPSRR